MIHANLKTKELTFEIERSGGFATFQGSLISGTPKPTQGQDLIVWENGIELYSGQVVSVSGSELTGWQIAGRNNVLSRHVFPSGFAIPPLSEGKAWDILRRALQVTFPAGDFSFVGSSTLQCGEVNLGGKTVAEGLREFERASTTPFAWGVRANNQIYVVNITDGVSFPLQTSISWKKRIKEVPAYRYIKFISGDTQKFPPLFTNTQFKDLESHPSKIKFSELNVWSSIQTKGTYNDSLGSAADGLPVFDRNAGASIQLRPGGIKAYELDHIGENIRLNNTAQQYFYTVPGQRYCLRFFTQGEPLIATTSLQVQYDFNTGHTFGQVFTVDSTAEIEHRMYFTAPAGAVTSSLQFTKGDGAEGTDRGFFVFGICLFRDDTPYPAGWDLLALNNPDAIVDYGIREEGSLYVKSSLPLNPTADRWVSLRRQDASPISPSLIYTWVTELKAVTGEPWPQLQVVVEFFKSDGTLSTVYQSPVINISAPNPNYARTTNNFKAPDDAASCVASLRQLTNGAYLCRTFSMRDARHVVPNTVTLGDQIEFLYDSGNTASKEVVILSESAETYDDALKVIEGWRKIHDGLDPLDVELPFRSFDIEKNVRIVEENTRYSIEKIKYDISSMRVALSLGEKERTLEDIIGKIRKSSSSI